jgi:hypothetical protein
MVQESILSNDNDIEEASFDGLIGLLEGDNVKKTSDVIEIKIHVVFGHLAGASIRSVPNYYELSVEVAFCGTDKLDHVKTREWWKPINGTHITDIVQSRTNTSQLRSIASTVAEAYGADWFRLDAFIDSQGSIFVNEVTYPSSSEHLDPCTIPWLYDAYQSTSMEVVSSYDIMSDLLGRINITLADFVKYSDFHMLQKGSEDDYEHSDWKWLPTSTKSVALLFWYLLGGFSCMVLVFFMKKWSEKQKGD